MALQAFAHSNKDSAAKKKKLNVVWSYFSLVNKQCTVLC